jgi:hypothetical protein
MCLLELEDVSFYKFLFYFIFQGGLMAFFTIYLNNKSLQKQGINTTDQVKMDVNQERQLSTLLSKGAFCNFWNNSNDYKVVQSSDGSFDVNKRFYTSEFEVVINVSFVETPEPSIVLKSKPQNWIFNDLVLIHKTIDSVMDYILEKEKGRVDD